MNPNYTPLVPPPVAKGINKRWVARSKGKLASLALQGSWGCGCSQSLSAGLTQHTRSHGTLLHMLGGMLLEKDRISEPEGFHL